MRRSRWLSLVAVLLAFGLFAAACGDDSDDEAGDGDGDTTTTAAADGDGATTTTTALSFDFCEGGDGEFSGETLNILTPETASEAEGFMLGLKDFCDDTGVSVNLNATRDATTELNLSLAAGDPPDLVIIPQPGRGIAFCENGDAVEVAQETIDALFDQYDENWWDLASNLDGTRRCGVPNKGDVKSLVWYNVEVFETNNYEVPTTWDEMEALIDQILTDDVVAPFCIAMESSDATGWHYTDWMEDFMLRLQGPDVYDQWWRHDIPFNGPEVTAVAEFIDALWFREGLVFGGTDQIATTNFRDAAIPLVDGDCAMVKQASFYAAPIVENGGVIGETHDAFYLPPIGDEFGLPLLTAGTHVMLFQDNDAAQAAARHLGTAESANARIVGQGGGYLSPNRNHDQSLYNSDLERFFVSFLVSPDYTPRFDAADLMPGDIGSGSFWREPTDYVSGAISLTDMLDNIEEEWNRL